MKRKTLFLVSSVLLIVAVLTTGVLTACSAETTTVTSTAPGTTQTVTNTVTSTQPGTAVTVTNTITQPVTSTVVVTGPGGGEVVTITNTIVNTTTQVNNVTVTVTGPGGGTGNITVMNPAATNTMVAREPINPRLDSVDGKTIYLIDITWGGPDGARQVYDALEAWFATNHPTTNIVRKTKKGSYFVDDRDLWAEVGEQGDAAIVGISG